MLQGFIAPTLPYTCGQGLGSQDLAATRLFLSGAGITPVYEDDDFYSEYSASKAGRSTAKHGKTYNVALTRSMAIAKRDAQRRR